MSESSIQHLTLKHPNAQYRRLFETAKDGILILDGTTMKVIDANPFILALLGYGHDEMLGKELWEIGFFTDRVASQTAYTQLHLNGYIRYDHLPLETKDGKKAEVEFICNTYPVDNYLIAQCNIRDISARLTVERAQVATATGLASLSRRKDEFLAMLGHELRNPLAAVANGISVLKAQTDNLTDMQRAALGIIDNQVILLTRLVDDLLDVSRIISGKVQVRTERCDIKTIMQLAVDTARPLIDDKRHRLDVTFPTDNVFVDADCTRLQQVVVNLLHNAAKYTEISGQIWLTGRQEGGFAIVSVRETGLGIAPEMLATIFDLFTQVEKSLDRSQGGLGIGLTLVQRIVEMHGGTVVALSAGLGRGSEFVVRLPIALEVVDDK